MHIVLDIDIQNRDVSDYVQNKSTEELKDLFLNFLNKEVKALSKKKFDFEKKDPKKYSSKIQYDSDNEDLSDVKPYDHVEDSGQYVHDLRRQNR